jgi:hypothetical protein
MYHRYSTIVPVMMAIMFGTILTTTGVTTTPANKVLGYESSQAGSLANACGNGDSPFNILCQNLFSQIQGDGNAVNIIGGQKGGERTTPSEDATNGGAADIEDEQAFAAAPTKRYQAVVTLTDVPAGAEDLIMNATLNRALAFTEFTTVTSPSDGDVVKFVFNVPKDTVLIDFVVCGEQAISGIADCDLHPLPNKVSGPIRVDYQYPQ